MSAHVIVFGNEKGGAGKSTLAIHVACALLDAGKRVAVLDLDLRQRSLGRFFENRAAWAQANGVTLPLPSAPDMGDGVALARADETTQLATFEQALEEARRQGEFVCIDTPGGDTPITRAAHAAADQIVTPMNDSFVDFDMLGTGDPVTLEVKRPSMYAETVWEARKRRAVAGGRPIDWIVLSNRLAVAAARNRQRLDERIAALARPGHLPGALPVRPDGGGPFAGGAPRRRVAGPRGGAAGTAQPDAGAGSGRGDRAGRGGLSRR
jgi:chromosome partitioning protein